MMHLKDDPSHWWEKDHDDRCNISVLGAEPLVMGGDCTCAARLPEFVVTASDGVSYVDGFWTLPTPRGEEQDRSIPSVVPDVTKTAHDG